MTQGIYVEPRAVAASPDYARSLFEDAGITVFQLRTGFDPSGGVPALQPAIEVVRDLGAEVWLLVGTWWGHGIEPGDDRMTPVAARDRAGLAPAHEAQWAMRTPGGPADNEIIHAIEGLCRLYQPAGICLTHARFRHPADLPGLFDWGPGAFADGAEEADLTPEILKTSWERAVRGLRDMGDQRLRELAGECSPVGLLDRLAGGDVMERWFAYRCRLIARSIERLGAAARRACGRQIRFGVNAYRPSAAWLAGQDYEQLSAHCDFIQPLLGYVRWHALHPVAAWARLFMDHGDQINQSDAIEAAAEVLGIDSAWVPEELSAFAETDEGDPDTIFDLVEAESMLSASYQTPYTDIMPVLRGRDWPVHATAELTEAADNLGLGGMFFQGTDYLAGPPPRRGMGMTNTIQPYKTGEALAEEIRETRPGATGVAVWWLGQSGYVLKSREITVVIDPYLSEHLTGKYADTEKPHIRITRCPLRGAELQGIDLVISSHKHSDHMDPATIPDLLKANPDASYLIPRAHKEHVIAWGVPEDRLLPADVDVPVERPGITVLPKPAAHDHLDQIVGVGYPYMGFRLRMGGLQIYHSGDTVPYRGLVDHVAGSDLAFLPINGRDARRVALGTPGNTSIDEALCIAALAGVGVLVPHHYDLFTFNTADINEFTERARIAYPDQPIRVLECGRLTWFGGN